MNDHPALTDTPGPQNADQLRTVPGNKSKAIFDREGQAMAPGLQSIALYSQITVDHARGCTVTDADGWDIMLYVKNLLDTTAITGAFLNSDDTALTTNVFTTDPRLYGIRITKSF